MEHKQGDSDSSSLARPDELLEWRQDPVTESLVRRLRREERRLLDRLRALGRRQDSAEGVIRHVGGQLDRVLWILELITKQEDEDDDEEGEK